MEITLFGKQIYIKKVLLISVSIILILGLGGLGYFLKQVYKPLSSSDIEVTNTSVVKAEKVESSGETNSSEELDKVEEEPEIKVYVVGCVNKPGVVTIKKGQVIDDAIKMAGGATEEADLENINLAYIINENTMLRIKAKVSNIADNKIISENNSKENANIQVDSNKPKANVSQQKTSVSANFKSDENSSSNVLNSGVDIIKDSMGCVVEAPKTGSKEESSLININTASQSELESLPNVGPATAKAIISYREKNGGFKKLTDIMKITGIKQKTFDKIKDFICIE
ncbi:helix-hairpin-helix domain-containing protein [Ruminiclostridium herbifermentans]|uniref:Helix-hairpin-helix domain-containing protein n=1 Tax=Ruminiclostridium herbifermentans TaxID=2488810 RepID=A0A4U7JE42_9FIRM|nr:helix-hairpin-helix domain-containing protein [Ruminiclostridium herbifermentans]QNU68882.1 helix-hairpin-helix domain-containing protein [Ruminiclostridium herbifermentans]